MMKYWKKTQFSLNKHSQNMMYFDKRPAFRAAVFFLAILILGCEKPEESLGLDLQPDEDIIDVALVDTFSVISFTLEEDSIRTDPINDSPGLVGAYIDPVFGFAMASHYTEIRLTTSNPSFIPSSTPLDQVEIDSLILTLSLEDFGTLAPLNSQAVYGGMGQQYFQVFELDEILSLDSNYYSNDKAMTFTEDLIEPGFNLIAPNPKDSVTVGGTKQAPQIRIPLKKELGMRFIEGAGSDGLSAEEFRELFNGLHITVDPNAAGVNLNNTGIISFDTFNRRSKIEMYYRDLVQEDTLFYQFEIRSNTGKFNAFEHRFTQGGDAPLVRQVVYGEEELGQQDLYVQAMGGTKLFIDFPFIEELRSIPEIAINKAELIIPVRDGGSGRFDAPSGLFLFALDEDGNAFLTPDQIDGSSIAGGTFDLSRGEYRFSISRYLQQVLSSEREFYGLEIVVRNAAYTANRAIINGPEYPDPENPDNNLKLTISFTKY